MHIGFLRGHSFLILLQSPVFQGSSAFQLATSPQSIKAGAFFCQKALGKSIQRLYYALTPQRADDPW
jgi:hypothetical protein